ncbi:integrase catalytic domain-containing protein [Nephila pilipes]|uniref:Integrase catalytic domain-containing protein n=1 Tax=Nephila pilipes TaxID=299642 RepID=A0A8X6QVT3_NEPPI|nr:integrase catalytic domain-containing protein [Nephila pilipes]
MDTASQRSCISKSAATLTSYENEIHVLFGADIPGKLFTGRCENRSSGLPCIETLLGWTIIGKTDKWDSKDRNNFILSLRVINSCISDLWSIVSLGILDLSETQSKR